MTALNKRYLRDSVAACMNEVVLLHQFLQAWLKGEIGEPGSQPLRLASVLHENFMVVHPTGQQEDRHAVISNFQNAWKSRPSDFSIRISDMRHELGNDSMQVISYIETHLDTTLSRRKSTAIIEFTADETLNWRYLHETRIESSQAESR